MLRRTLPVMTVALLLLASPQLYALGSGNGVTKIDFKLKLGDTTSSRLFAKLNVATGVQQLLAANPEAKGNHALAGYTLDFTINSAVFSGTADEKGKVPAPPFDAKLTANGQVLQLKATGLNLEQLFPVQTADGKYSVAVTLKVTASRTATDATGTPTTTTTVLNEQTVTFNYDVKKGQVKGKNF